MNTKNKNNFGYDVKYPKPEIENYDKKLLNHANQNNLKTLVSFADINAKKVNIKYKNQDIAQNMFMEEPTTYSICSEDFTIRPFTFFKIGGYYKSIPDALCCCFEKDGCPIYFAAAYKEIIEKTVENRMFDYSIIHRYKNFFQKKKQTEICITSSLRNSIWLNDEFDIYSICCHPSSMNTFTGITLPLLSIFKFCNSDILDFLGYGIFETISLMIKSAKANDIGSYMVINNTISYRRNIYNIIAGVGGFSYQK